LHRTFVALEPTYHQRALKRRDNRVCDPARLYLPANFVAPDSLFHNPLKLRFPLLDPFKSKPAKDRVPVIGVDGGIHQWLSRVFGRKNYYMACVALFTITSSSVASRPLSGPCSSPGGLAPVE
jgi:hypothetical protein